jgi:hypothetical protein
MTGADRRAPFGWIPGKEHYRPFRHITDCALYHENLRVTCPRCGNSKVFSSHALWWLFHKRRWDDALRSAGRRFRCLVCDGARGQARATAALTITRDNPTGPQPPMPDEREWKRLVNRQRS